MSDSQAFSSWVQRWLSDEGIPSECTDDGDVIELTIPGSDDRKMRIVLVGQDFLAFSMVTQAKVPRKRWTALYPLLAEANAELVFGAWVLDPESERIAFRCAMPGRGAVYEPECLKGVLMYVADTVRTMESRFRAAVGDDILSSWMDESATEETPSLGSLLDDA